MQKEVVITIALVALVALAGCHGGGGSDEPDRSIDITNDQRYESGVSPADEPLIKADATREDELENVTLAWTAYNRSGSPAMGPDADGTKSMTEEGDRFRASLPDFPAGYQVEYEVRANYNDNETYTDDASYTVSYVESVDGPNTNAETANLTTDVSVELYSTTAVKRVELVYERDFTETGNVEQETVVIARDPNTTTVTGSIQNEEDGESANSIDVNYSVRVVYGQNTSLAYRTGNRTYRYRNDKPDVLYVPITFDDSDTSTNFADPKDVDADLDSKAAKSVAYYRLESRGEAAFDYVWARNDTPNDYFVLPGHPLDYRGQLEETHNSSFQQGNATINVTELEYAHDERAIRQAARTEVEQEANVDLGSYEAVVFVYPKLNGTETTTWKTANETMRLPNGTTVSGNNRSYVVDRGKNWENAVAYGNDAYIIQSADYGTHVHEIGHAAFEWADYYNTNNDERGITGSWALMGNGNYNDEHPSQVMSYHKLQEGWITSESLPVWDLDHNESRTRFIPYMKDSNTVDPGYRVVDVRLSALTLFDSYLFEARDPPNDELPRQPGFAGGNRQGLVAYAVGNDQVNVVWSQTPNSGRIRRPSQPTLAAGNYSGQFYDPDAGIAVTLDRDPRAPAEGLKLNVTRVSPRNLKGVNVFYRIDCENITTNWACSRYRNQGSEGQPATIGVVAHTEEGRVGTTANGTIINEVEGAYVVSAGTAQKVYLPRNLSARFVVNTSTLPGEASVNVTSQTVTRDSEGTRIASTLTSETVAGNTTDAPPLARLNASQATWDAGRLRTLQGNSTTVAFQNTGIDELTNVTVTTDGALVSVNRTDVGALSATERVQLELDADVPGGKPVGVYTTNVTVTGDGPTGQVTQNVTVTVSVLPTVYWNATPAAFNGTIAETNTTTLSAVVSNSEASNVPLRDVETTISGAVTTFRVDAPRFVETVEPGANVTLTTTFTVPDGGIENGSYAGTLAVSPRLNYEDYYDYPVTIPGEYTVPEPASETTNVTVQAVGPSVDSAATFHPTQQVAMRKGAATERVTVDPVSEGTEIPAEEVTVRAEIPDGWTYTGNAGANHLKVWIVTEKRDTKAGHGGKRVQLTRDDYDLTVTDDAVVLHIDDVRETTFGRYMNENHVLEFEFKLDKRPKATTYRYVSQVDAATTSPVGVYRTERPTAAIDVFTPPAGTPPGQVGNGRHRVANGRIAVSKTALGTNATLAPTRLYVFDRDGEQQRWARFRLEATESNRTRNVWLPVEEVGGGYQIEVDAVDEDRALLGGVVTRNVQGAVSSALRDGKPIRIAVPMDGNVSGVSALQLTVAGSDNVTGVTLATPDGDASAAADPTVPLHVVVGNDVFDAPVDRRDGDSSEADDRARHVYPMHSQRGIVTHS
ncbi:hypothetical protein [Haloarchaeobius sp. HME9146]|uniref:hypothetical protein n=1 Tax=Haloarchaeobius sp. HME9146 TaxID=2978732 RepID=UPI0021BF0EDA|nr:hypothetical protein [Haloarchaeobius sp. HME9146]MCT9098149.1 hypothetical protein [Haloarchaeobius sp. HME9146]